MYKIDARNQMLTGFEVYGRACGVKPHELHNFMNDMLALVDESIMPYVHSEPEVVRQHVPDDTPCLDDSFHRHEMDID